MRKLQIALPLSLEVSSLTSVIIELTRLQFIADYRRPKYRIADNAASPGGHPGGQLCLDANSAVRRSVYQNRHRYRSIEQRDSAYDGCVFRIEPESSLAGSALHLGFPTVGASLYCLRQTPDFAVASAGSLFKPTHSEPLARKHRLVCALCCTKRSGIASNDNKLPYIHQQRLSRISVSAAVMFAGPAMAKRESK